MIKELGMTAVAVALVAVAMLQIGKPPVNVQVVSKDGEAVVYEGSNVGTIVGPEVSDHMFFNAGMAEGGVFTIATTGATLTLRDGDIREAKVISISALSTSSALALTLPASSSWPSLPKNGTAQEWIIDNLQAAATTTTITAGAGVDIDGTGANDDVINGDASGILNCWRLPSSNVRCIVQEMVDAG